MEPERWRRVAQVLDAALTRDPAEWSAVLDQSCSGDPELRREVEAMLRRADTAGGFLQHPPAAVAAALLADSAGARETLQRARVPLEHGFGVKHPDTRAARAFADSLADRR